MEDFKNELKELLKKHNATIGFETDGEGYSMTVSMYLETNKNGFECLDFPKYKEEITQFDL